MSNEEYENREIIIDDEEDFYGHYVVISAIDDKYQSYSIFDIDRRILYSVYPLGEDNDGLLYSFENLFLNKLRLVYYMKSIEEIEQYNIENNLRIELKLFEKRPTLDRYDLYDDDRQNPHHVERIEYHEILSERQYKDCLYDYITDVIELDMRNDIKINGPYTIDYDFKKLEKQYNIHSDYCDKYVIYQDVYVVEDGTWTEWNLTYVEGRTKHTYMI